MNCPRPEYVLYYQFAYNDYVFVEGEIKCYEVTFSSHLLEIRFEARNKFSIINELKAHGANAYITLYFDRSYVQLENF